MGCNDSNSTFLEELKSDDSQVYLIYRGTNSKEGFFAKEFNISDTLSTHVGLLIYDKGNSIVHHVVDTKSLPSDYKVETIDDFLNIEKEDIYYTSIWQINHLDTFNFKSIKRNLEKFNKLKIKFDKSFSSKDSTKLYCSEFIFKVLNNIDSEKFNIKTRKRKLSGIYKTYFRKDTLEYYPVDVFQFNGNIVKVKEWHFK